MKNHGILASALLLAAALAAQAADGATQYTAKPGSKMRIEGTSNVHDWQVEGVIIGGNLELGFDPAKATPGKATAKATVSVPVRSLKSVNKDGTPYNAKMDDIMCGLLLEQPIKFVLTELTVKEAKAGEPVTLEAKGDLTAAGQTKPITFPAKLTPMPDDKLKISGTAATKMTDFGIKPPEPLGLGIKTGDDVKLVFDWVVGKKKA
jgi:polyisoprenoid-binding protein YceI